MISLYGTSDTTLIGYLVLVIFGYITFIKYTKHNNYNINHSLANAMMNTNTCTDNKLDEFISDDLTDIERMYQSINMDYHSTINNTNGNEDINPKILDTNFLFQIEKFVNTIMTTNHQAFKVIEENGVKKYLPLELAKYKDLVRFYNRYIRPKIKYSELVQVFINSIHESKIIDVSISTTVAKTRTEKIIRDLKYDGKFTDEQFHNLVELIRTKLKSQEFLDKLAARKYNPKRRQRNLVKFLNELFAKHSRLLVCRIDVYIKPEFKDQMTIDEMHKHREHFQNNLRSNSFFDDFVGFIWKLEAGDRRGMHFHFFFFLLGSTHKSDKYISHQIGKYFEQISNNQLYGYNCNARRNYYKRRGIGMINHFDVNLRENLENAVEYLTKSDQFFRINENNRRVIGKGFINRTPKSNAGRPRTRASD